MYLLGLSLRDHENVRRSIKPKYAAHLRTHLTNRKWWPTESNVQRFYNSDKRADKQIA